MTHEMEAKLNEALEKKDAGLYRKIMTLILLQRQISDVLKIALNISKEMPLKYQVQQAFVEDMTEIEGKVNDMFEVLSDFLIRKYNLNECWTKKGGEK